MTNAPLKAPVPRRRPRTNTKPAHVVSSDELRGEASGREHDTSTKEGRESLANEIVEAELRSAADVKRTIEHYR